MNIAKGGGFLRPKVKICGLTRAEDVQICFKYGADILGFVTEYIRPVPWNLDAQSAKKLILDFSGMAETCSDVSRVAETCIVTGGPPDKVIRLAEEIQPDYIQLHGGEPLAWTSRMIDELKHFGIKVIKTLFPDTPDLEKTAAQFCAVGVYALLFDPRTPDHPEKGGHADLSLFMRLQSAADCPVILAGGINPENVAGIVLKTEARMIDLMTGVECRYGVKDEEKVKALFRALGAVTK